LKTTIDDPVTRDEALVPREEVLPQPAADVPRREALAGPRRRLWIWLAAIGAAILLAVLFSVRSSQQKKAKAVAAKKEAASRPVPVSGIAAKTGDLGIYISGLGTVTAINTVTVRSRVDGQLLRVHFREGQVVHEGDLLAEIDPRPFQVQLMQAEGQRAKDEATLANARVDLARYETLVKEDSISRQQLDTQAATVRQLEASVKSDQGQIESAKLNLVYSRITAPITGQAGLRLVDQGNIVHAGDPNGLVVITQLQPITVLFTVPADRLPQVLQQMRGSGKALAVDAYDRDMKNRLAQGTVLAVDNQIDPATGTVKIKAIFTNETSTLYPNQFVNARLLVDTLKSATLIPSAAVQRSPQSTFVYAVKPDSTVDMRPVEVQLTEGDETAIRKGVQPGEVVIVEGVDKLQPGSKVAVGAPGAPAPRPGGGSREAPREGKGSARKKA
jgi:membrane fusion protein, multidrug efflux system